MAENFPAEFYAIFEECIGEEALEATDRRKIRQVCRKIKDFAAIDAKEKAIEFMERLAAMYPRRPAMREELVVVKNKLENINNEQG